MSDQVFGPVHAEVYDLIYADKDYAGECDAVESLLERYGQGPRTPDVPRRLMDVGCGTANHALEMASRGYRVTGIDRSAPMVEVARAKARRAGLDVDLQVADALDLDRVSVPGGSFDAAMVMFTVIGYFTEEGGLDQLLGGIRSRLKEGGLLVADYWYGPAVLAQGPTTRFRAIDGQGRRVLRCAQGEIDVDEQVYTIDLEIWVIEEDRLVGHAKETHRMHFFFPAELKLLLEANGFELVCDTSFPDIGSSHRPGHWWAALVGRAVPDR